MKARKTKDRILDTSIRLFNERKASNVSTVQISAEMGISPGNLYYYYDNKEEVIRCIWTERMKSEAEALVEKYAEVRSAADFIECIREALKHCLKYRFFYTEPVSYTHLRRETSESKRSAADILQKKDSAI